MVSESTAAGAGVPRITELDFGNTAFVRGLRKLPPEILREAESALRSLKNDYPYPASLHFHPLHGVTAIEPGTNNKIKIFTIHVSKRSSYKASFTIHGQTARMRQIGKHDWIDKSP